MIRTSQDYYYENVFPGCKLSGQAMAGSDCKSRFASHHREIIPQQFICVSYRITLGIEFASEHITFFLTNGSYGQV